MENGTPTQHRGDDSVDHGTVVPVKKIRSENDKSQGGSHRRSISGNLLASLPFLKTSPKDLTSQWPPTKEPTGPAGDNASENPKPGSSSIANALRQSQGRKRKGSLRRLATGKMMRERRNSILNQQERLNAQQPTPSINGASGPPQFDHDPASQRFGYENASFNSSSDSGWSQDGRLANPSISNLNLNDHGKEYDNDQPTPRILETSPLESPVGPYASTTDDDESLSFYRPTVLSSSSSYGVVQRQSPLSSALQRRRSNRSGQTSSLTVVNTPTDAVMDDDWDYSETEWWGWVVLIVTWIVFVVGMGSCLGVWSWAWDVGETPYAPPELEDDATLPITGYYPALMLCTAVMAWVWVVVAWVGMKYFRHAKVVGEDS
ncbi:hypothetical protein BU24DRAFT_197058 [Aaosphaeria arxii CBS 175.79]|uniref:Uncharacterized protein n=1 Tax=Aaosphaeria arxii CBS 175.79 TaxID=1450172 RepID=A0A6A5XTT4_9PLEO|nr:uncharacterized protein BU24DRAFT_197058 [Aaosphaeria arxii CBS 175.79]KAF2016227.1 hypothetical protein BU24DRAFT_197058 [Aaosphaeria arxii CBS 175.79]